VSAIADAYDIVLRCPEAPELGGRAPSLNTYVERDDGRLEAVLTPLDTGAAISVFDGRIAVAALQFDPRRAPTDVVPLAGWAGGLSRLGYVHQVRCYFGGYARFAALFLHVAFTDPDDTPPTFNVLGREGLHGAQERGFFSQVQFGYRHRVPGGPAEVYLTFEP
jgi:hypothetical protein